MSWSAKDGVWLLASSNRTEVHHDNELPYEVEVEEPDPYFATTLREGMGGLEGRIRVPLQYMFRAMGTPKGETEDGTR